MNTVTNTPRPGFTSHIDPRTQDTTYIPCLGATGHRGCGGVRGTCDGCGQWVVKTDKGRILDMTTVEPYHTACWAPSHVCDAQRAAGHAEAVAARIASGEIMKGATVVVVKGRKVPVGTVGRVVWLGEDGWGKARVGFVTDDGVKHFTAAVNVEATP